VVKAPILVLKAAAAAAHVKAPILFLKAAAAAP